MSHVEISHSKEPIRLFKSDILEYLHDFCTMLKMRPVLLDTFPYLSVAGQGDIAHDAIFRPFERAKDLARILVEELV